MQSVARRTGSLRPRVMQRLGQVIVLAAGWLLLAIVVLCHTEAARASEPELTNFELVRDEEGLFLNYAVDLELSRSVDDALNKAVPLFFVAEAEVFRNRFYWRDQRVGYAIRRWRIVFQPLTATYRVTFDGGLSQNYPTRAEAFASISRSSRWRIAEPGQVQDGSRHYVEFSFRLDTAQLPRPMQIGIGGQADWTISVQRTQKIVQP
jgi:hypothetical protein